MNPLRNPQSHDPRQGDLPDGVSLQGRIDALYEEIRTLVTSYAGRPGLREALLPLQDKMHLLHEIEAEEITRRYDSHLQAKYDEAKQRITQQS